MNVEGLRKKVLEYNEIFKNEQQVEHELNEKNVFMFNFILDMLKNTSQYHISKLS